ncbi:hypothetical protein [Streptomyces sp. CBMA123]|uniref:hypothetical protein n=1 Tax=Streptomyces sp. CBMA123 TaxID=1896313 RepID=UPI0016620854|nr:hypothetical protein [Streptomyces sp. CBMA123]MBD0688432.1 hypothetical protein [Streptomyces sp. CBMA123]
MVSNSGRRWEDARAKAREFQRLDRDVRDVLALIYYLIVAQDGGAMDQVSLRSVRYRLADPQRLHRDLAELLPGPAREEDWTRPVETGLAELAQARLVEHGQDYGPFTGPPPVEGTVWRLWYALNARHGVPLEDTLPSDMVTEDVYGRYRSSGMTVFEHAVRELTTQVDQVLLPASGALSLQAHVEVTGGMHAGRTGRLRAIAWGADDEQGTCTDAPAVFRVDFDDRHESADVAPGDIERLPEWDRRFVVVHAGEPLPTEWAAAVLLATAGSSADWHDDAVEHLRRWQGGGRMVVLLARPRHGQALSAEEEQWVAWVAGWADEIIAVEPDDRSSPPRLAPDQPADALHHPARLTLAAAPGRTPAPEDAPSWARTHRVAVAPTITGAIEAALRRIGRGHQRAAGHRKVPLLIARSAAFSGWYLEQLTAGTVLEEARLEWACREEDASEPISWWALRVRLRHEDRSRSEETVLAHPGLLSVVVYHPREPWTDTEVVLLPSPAAARGKTREFLRLPTIINNMRAGGGNTDRAWSFLVEGLNLFLDSDRLRGSAFRNDSQLISARRSVVRVALTDAELDDLQDRLELSPVGAPEVHRLADLMANPVCDWATLGAITTAVQPNPPTASLDPWAARQRMLQWREAVRRATTLAAPHHEGSDVAAVRDVIAMTLYALHLRARQPVAEVSWWTVLFHLQDDQHVIDLVEQTLQDTGHDVIPRLSFRSPDQRRADPIARRWDRLNRPQDPPAAGPHDGPARRPDSVPDARDSHRSGRPDPIIRACVPRAAAAVHAVLEDGFTERQRIRVTAGPYEGRAGFIQRPVWRLDRETLQIAVPPAAYVVDLDDLDDAAEINTGQLASHTDGRSRPGAPPATPHGPAADPTAR